MIFQTKGLMVSMHLPVATPLVPLSPDEYCILLAEIFSGLLKRTKTKVVDIMGQFFSNRNKNPNRKMSLNVIKCH